MARRRVGSLRTNRGAGDLTLRIAERLQTERIEARQTTRLLIPPGFRLDRVHERRECGGMRQRASRVV